MTQIHIDRRVLYGFMMLMLVTNAMGYFVLWRPIRAGRNDFPTFYSRAQMVREGQGARLYDYEAQNSFIRRVSAVPREPFNHVPYELLIFIPFTYLQFIPAYIAWSLLDLGMLAGVVLLLQNFRPSGSSFCFIFLIVLGFYPVWYCLLWGQDSIVLLFLFALSFWFWKRGKEDAAGFVLALGLFRPQLVLPFVLVAFLAGKWKFVRGFIPGAVLVVTLSTWVVGFHGMADYARILVSQGTEKSARVLDQQWKIDPARMATWRGFLWVSLPGEVPSSVRNFLLLSGTFVGLFWAAKKLRSAKDSASFDLSFAMSVAIIALASFHSFLNDFSLLIIPILIFGAWLAPPRRVSRKSGYAIVTLGFLFFLTPLYIALLWAERVGLLLLPASAAIWLMSREEMTARP